MLSVQSNMPALNAGRQFNMVIKKEAKHAEKLSSGFRINRAADDAAGLAISEKMRYRIRGLRQGAENTQDGISWVQTGDGAMNEINDIVNRMTELCVKAATETLTDVDRGYIDQEVQALKEEINKIAHTTTFNELAVFDESRFSISLTGQLTDIEVFDAAYDDETGDVSFGGFIFAGVRVKWDQITGLISEDNNGWHFNAGNYSYTQGGMHVRIFYEDGAKMPRIERTMSVSANANGILIDGVQYDWSHLVDDDGKACSADNIHNGVWTMNYYGSKIAFSFGEELSSFEEMVKEINGAASGSPYSNWEISYSYSDNVNEKAVDVDGIPGMRITDYLADILDKNGVKYDFVIRADADGIWMEGSDGKEITNSRKSWADMEIASWDSGGYISSHKEYSYTMSNNDIVFSFAFTLSNVTSLDSVIDGLDGMDVNSLGIITSYETDVDPGENDNVLKSSSRVTGVDIDFEDEVKLGRVFNDQTWTANNSGINVSSGQVSLQFTGRVTNNNVMSFVGNTAAAESVVSNAVSGYIDYVLKRKTSAALAGRNPNMDFRSLEDLIGAGNVSSTGSFDYNDRLTLTDDMKLTDGTGSTFPPGKVGNAYPYVFIDFKAINNLYDLDELGFNSTCSTCTNHYSIVFKRGLGSEYKYSRDGANNHTLEIDLDTLVGKGITGADLADEIVRIASEAYDFHYTQYASKDGILYIFDDRTNPAQQRATFDTRPFDVVDTCDFSVTMTDSANNAQIGLDYTYQFRDVANWVRVEMVKVQTPPSGSSAGEYYKLNDDGITYSLWDGSEENVQLYTVSVSYSDPDNENVKLSKSEAAQAYARQAVSKTLEKTKVDLKATDYSYLKLGGDENSNVAVRARFRSEVGDISDKRIRIKHSNDQFNSTVIPHFAVDTLSLGLTRAGTGTRDQALRTLKYLKNASLYVADKRTIYGALQNRLEHTYNNNRNAEENLETADSRIRDTDVAKTIVDYVNQTILSQASVSVLTHANQRPDYILQLLQ